MSFKNSILIVAFNYSAHLHHIPFFISYYEKHFKKIIFYSDYPEKVDLPYHVNYVDIFMGCFLHNIFKHFYNTYESDIASSDGLF